MFTKRCAAMVSSLKSDRWDSSDRRALRRFKGCDRGENVWTSSILLRLPGFSSIRSTNPVETGVVVEIERYEVECGDAEGRWFGVDVYIPRLVLGWRMRINNGMRSSDRSDTVCWLDESLMLSVRVYSCDCDWCVLPVFGFSFGVDTHIYLTST